MSRSVLLIDSDTGFRDTLSNELSRYRTVVITEADPERAMAIAASDPPDLLIIAVDEPEKQGFKTFQKARKTLPAKLPVMLVTSSLPVESFTKHRGMKVHADEYVDKRGLDGTALIARLSSLIDLGEPEDELPVGEDIPMELGDGDVVLDEQVDDDDVGSFAHDQPNDMATVNPNSEVLVDRMVAQETDAAFDALLGDDMFGGGEPEGAAPIALDASPEPAEAVDDGIPEPVPHKIPDNDPEPAPTKSQWDIDSVPAPIRDGGRETGDDFDSYSKMAAKQAEEAPAEEPVAHAAPAPAPDAIEEPGEDAVPPLPVDEEPAAPAEVDEPAAAAPVEAAAPNDDDFAEEEVARDSMSSIPIVDDDLVSLDDEMPVEVADDDGGDAAAPASEAGLEDEDRGERTMIASAPAAFPPPARSRPPTEVPPLPTRTRPPTAAPVPIPNEASAPAAAREPSAPVRATREPSAPQPKVDLGLDSIAQNVAAEREQSGAYDHKSVRKVGELERQITQLKAELERARSAADAAASGNREAQFLNLREQNLARENELKEAQRSLEQHAKDLAGLDEKLRHAQHAKEKLEKMNAQLEQKLFDGKERELEETLKEVNARLQQTEQELDRKSKAAMSAETALAQMERDLASERANRAASASEAEKTLRLEREQLVQRHKGELAAVKAEAESAQEFALARLREQLEAAHAATLEESIEEVRRANATEHNEIVETLEQKHSGELVHLKSEQAGELARIKNELGSRVAELEAQIAGANESHVVAIAGAEAQLAHATAELEARYKAALDQAAQERAQAEAALKAELEQTRAKYEAELEAREEEANEARERDAESHGQVLAQLKSQLDRTVAAHEVKIATAHREIGDLAKQHEAAQAELGARHEAALAELRSKHAEEIAQLADGAKRNAETHRAALAEQQQKYETQIADLTEQAQRELAEQRAQVHAAKKAMEEATARYQAEREEIEQQHRSAMGELEGKHERAIAVVNGEALKAKSIADAEHGKELQSLRAEADRKVRELEEAHARAMAELTADRDELKKGLSGARDSLKRSEGELAAAVQTIADRNADLRAHAAAIAERDQRITELRAEIESLEGENANYQEQVLRAYQKIKSDEAMVARARKAMAIALTVLDDQGNPTTTKSET